MKDKVDYSYNAIWKAIIRPDRDDYNELNDLGTESFSISGINYVRTDYEILVTKGNSIKCSLIQPDEESRPSIEMPLVIYLHGNASSRCEGIKNAHLLLPKGINVFTYDFAGCGKSEGDYISLGYHEKNDLKIIVDFVMKIPGVGKIGLWGRSMGAATAMIYAHRDKRVKVLCVDSPFARFIQLAKEICLKYQYLPDFVLGIAMSFIRKTIMKENDFDINSLNPIEDAEKTEIPVFFIHALKDDLIKYEHSVELFEACKKKDMNEFIVCEGTHNTPRQKHVQVAIANFFDKHLVKNTHEDMLNDLLISNTNKKDNHMNL